MWYVAQAWRTGLRHQTQQQVSQDHIGTKRSAAGLLLALADGAGSARCGKEGARLAVETALKTLSREQNLESCLSECKKNFKALIEKKGQPEDYHTTLSAMRLREDQVQIMGVGDSPCVIMKEGKWKLGLQLSQGEYSGETAFLAQGEQESWAEHQGEFVAICSDGLWGLLFKDKAPHIPSWERILSWTQEQETKRQGAEEYMNQKLSELLLAAEKSGRTDDDLSIIIAWRQI